MNINKLIFVCTTLWISISWSLTSEYITKLSSPNNPSSSIVALPPSELENAEACYAIYGQNSACVAVNGLISNGGNFDRAQEVLFLSGGMDSHWESASVSQPKGDGRIVSLMDQNYKPITILQARKMGYASLNLAITNLLYKNQKINLDISNCIVSYKLSEMESSAKSCAYTVLYMYNQYSNGQCYLLKPLCIK